LVRPAASISKKAGTVMAEARRSPHDGSARDDIGDAVLSETATPDLEMMRRHIEALLPKDDDDTVEIAHDNPANNKVDTARQFRRDELDDAVDWAANANGNGCNVYVGAAARKPGNDARRARDIEISGSKFVWADADGDVSEVENKLERLGLRPSLVVETGTEPELRRQYWFRLEDYTKDLAVIKSANQSLQDALGTDAVSNASRVMRLAGSVSYPKPKKRADGYVTEVTRLVEHEDAASVDADRLCGLKLPDRVETIAPGLSDTDALPPIDNIVEAMEYIPAADYDTWINMGMALKNSYGDEGFDAWESWSAQDGKKYFPDEGERSCEEKWRSFDTEPRPGVKQIKVGTIIYLARQGGWAGNGGSVQRNADAAANSGQGVELFTIAELLDRPPPKFLIEDIFPEKGVAVIGGQSGSMKTFLMIYLAFLVATGKKLDTKAVKQTGVLFLNNEGQAGFGRRCQAAAAHLGIEIPDNFRVAEITPNLMREETLAQFLEAGDELEYIPGLIVLDTFSKATIGGNDNDTSDMAMAIATAYKLANHFDALVVLIDHVGKEPKKGLRGAYSKYANADMVGMVSKAGDTVTLKTVKQKEAEDDLRFDFKVNLVKVKSRTDGEVAEVPALSIRSKPFIPEQKDFIIAALEHNGRIDRKDLAKRFTGVYGDKTKKSFNEQLRRLKKLGKIDEVDGHVQLTE
jgi:hypothetical protein